MRHKVRRIRSPPKCAAETPPAEAETKNNTSKASVQQAADPKSLKAHGGQTANNPMLRRLPAAVKRALRRARKRRRRLRKKLARMSRCVSVCFVFFCFFGAKIGPAAADTGVLGWDLRDPTRGP